MVVINNSKEQQAVSLDRFQELLGNVKNVPIFCQTKRSIFLKTTLKLQENLV
jgi:hypothetical protein